MLFHEWKVLYFDFNSMIHKFVPNNPIDNKSALVQVVAWQQTCDKHGAILTKLTDAYMQHERGEELSMQQPYIYVTSTLQCTLGYSLSIYNHKSLLAELITHQQ